MSVADRSSVVRTLLPVGALALGVAGWWALTVPLAVPSYLLPSPVEVAAALGRDPAFYLRNAWFTFEKIAYGGTIGVTAGFLLAVLISTVPWARRVIHPYLVTARVLPKLAIAPVLLIYMGTGFSTAIVFVALIAFFPMVVSASAGFDTTPEGQLDLLRSVRADPVRGFLFVRLPNALPDVFAGLEQSVTLSVVGAVVAEWIVADSGLGFLVLFASENVQTDVMIAAVTLVVVEGLALYGAVLLVERRVLWRVDDRE